MERNDYLKKCQAASCKVAYSGSWWLCKWDSSELVTYNGNSNLPKGDYIPYDYRFGFDRGNPRHIAILHSLTANTEYQVLLDDLV